MTYTSTAGVGQGLEHLTANIVRVSLPLPLPDLKVVNAYAIVGGDGITLIDPGWASQASESVLVDALATLGAGPGDVRRILVTHQHWDHYSLGVRWRDEHGIELMLGREERHSIEAFTSMDGVHPVQVGMLVEAGAEALAAQIDELDWQSYERGVAFAPPDRWLDDGDVIDFGTSSIVVRATPGHTRGHIVFDDPARGLVFTGDHLLPRITPSIAFERQPEALPLRSYLDSLSLLLDIPDSRMLPAHGSTEHTTHHRAAELIAHHRDRLDVVTGLVAAGSSTSFEVSSKMRWTRHERTIGELDIVHRMAAILEVKAHLDLLAVRGVLTSTLVDGVREFALA